MQKVNISYVGLSAAASSALVQSVVEQLAPEGVVVIDRDENGADITVFDEGERFLLPETKLTVEDGVATIESNFAGDLRADFDELAREWEGKEMADAADLPDLDLRSWEPGKAFSGFNAAVKGLHVEAPISSGDTLVSSVSKPRIRAGSAQESEKCPLGEIHDRINGLMEQICTLNQVVFSLAEK